MNRALTHLLVLATSSSAFAVGTSESDAKSPPWRISANTHVLYSNETDNAAKGSRTFLNESNLRAEHGRYSLGIDFTDRYSPDLKKAAGTNRPFVLEKTSAAFEGEQWQIKLGDSYQELGRGIALSLYRDEVFGLDSTLQGASVRYTPHGLDVSGFGGRVHTLQVPVAINPQPNPLPTSDVFMVGGSAKVTVAEDTKIEGHYLLAKDQPLGRTRFDQGWSTAGGSVQADGIGDLLDLYGEANVMSSTTYGTQERTVPTGYGNYFSAVVSPQPWKVKVEVKDYRRFAFSLNRPPTLEEDVVPTLNTDNVSAGRFYAERRLGTNPGNLVHASFLYGWDNNYSTQVNHGVVGGKFQGPLNIGFEWRGGYRWLPGQSSLAHGSLKGKIHTGKGQTLELGWRKWYQRYGISLSPTDDDHNALDVSYVFSERYSLNLGYEYVPTVYDDENPHYFNAGGTIKLGGLSTRFYAGRTSGGFICSGGVCRQVLPYSGVYVDATYTF